MLSFSRLRTCMMSVRSGRSSRATLTTGKYGVRRPGCAGVLVLFVSVRKRASTMADATLSRSEASFPITMCTASLVALDSQLRQSRRNVESTFFAMTVASTCA